MRNKSMFFGLIEVVGDYSCLKCGSSNLNEWKYDKNKVDCGWCGLELKVNQKGKLEVRE